MFIWHGNNTKESAEALAKELKCDFGTLPPKGYDGEVFCLGAAPSDKFKWEERKFSRVINDPRKVRKFADKAKLSEKINLATQVRVYVLGGKVLCVNDTAGKDANLPKDKMDRVHNVSSSVYEAVEKADFFAIDGVVTDTLVISNVVFGPAVSDKPEVVKLIANGVAKEDAVEDEFLREVFDSASPEEKKSLVNLFERIRRKSVGTKKAKTA